jgi:hypothetical protein
MASRLSQVEKLNQEQATKITKQAEQLEALQSEVGRLRRTSGAAGRDGGRSETVERLRAERDLYKRQVEEMTQFLADYGLTWVGDGPDEEDEDLDANGGEDGGEDVQQDVRDNELCNGGSGRLRSGSVAEKLGRPPVAEGVSLDIKVIESRVQSLNAMVEKESARIVSSRVCGVTHARLVADDSQPSPLTFFQDGVKLGSHAFMTYELAPAQQLIRDILDGYFPYALKDDHPDGVAMKVLDRTSHVFADWLKSHARSDADLTDSGSRLAPAGVHALTRLSSGANFLGKLPEKVVRDGRICEIRGPVGQLLGTNAADQKPVEGSDAQNPAVAGQTGGEEVSLLLDDRNPTAPVARLQVKMEGGERVVMHMEPSHSIGDLEDAVARWRTASGLADSNCSQRLQLRTAFPRKVHCDRSQTLEEAGLVPSAALFVGLIHEGQCEASEPDKIQ